MSLFFLCRLLSWIIIVYLAGSYHCCKKFHSFVNILINVWSAVALSLAPLITTAVTTFAD